MHTLLASTATAILLATSAMADGHAAATYDYDAASDFYASTLIGMRVYATENDYDNDMFEADAELEWDDIGEINDLIVSKDGAVEAAIVGVGGFLGIGERDVALTMDQIRVMTEQDDPDDRFLVVKLNKEALEAAPAFEREPIEESTQTAMATDTANDADPTYTERPMLERPLVERDGYEVTTIDQLTAEDVDGAYVYGSKDETVGEVGELLLGDDGQIEQAVINVGGFLGIGEKPVAVTFDELQLLRNDDGDLRVYIDATQEALEAQPEYEG